MVETQPVNDMIVEETEADGYFSYKSKVKLLPKKIAAVEVYKWLKQLKLQIIIGMCASFIIPLVYLFNTIAGVGLILVVVGVGVFTLLKSNAVMKDLETRYDIPKGGLFW